jgi:hypothetical protein
MDDRLKQQLDEILEQAEVEERADTLLRQALTIDIPWEDGTWLRSMFQLAAKFLELAYGNKKEANRALPWLLFSLGMAYQQGASFSPKENY